MKSIPICELLMLLALTPLVGCKTLAVAAYSLAQSLDPAASACSHVPTCPMCCNDPMAPSYAAGPSTAGYPCHHCGHQQATPMSNDPYGHLPPVIEQELMSMRDQISRSSEAAEELARRNAELIQSRGDYHRVQEQIDKVRQDMLAWQNESRAIHQRLKDRDMRRRDSLERMNETIATIAEQR